MGPGEVHLIATAISAIKGRVRAIPMRAITMFAIVSSRTRMPDSALMASAATP